MVKGNKMKEQVKTDMLTTLFGSDFNWDKEVSRLRIKQIAECQCDEDPEYIAQQKEEFEKWQNAQGNPDLMKQYEV